MGIADSTGKVPMLLSNFAVIGWVEKTKPVDDIGAFDQTEHYIVQYCARLFAGSMIQEISSLLQALKHGKKELPPALGSSIFLGKHTNTHCCPVDPAQGVRRSSFISSFDCLHILDVLRPSKYCTYPAE